MDEKRGKRKKYVSYRLEKKWTIYFIFSLDIKEIWNTLLETYIPSQINHTSHIDISTLLEINKLNPEINKLKFSNIKQNLKEHNSLNDAMILKKCYEKLKIKC